MQEQKKKILIALKKARTSIDKIITRIENDGDADNGQCFDTMQQTLSAIGLLKNANNHILELHLAGYMKGLEGRKIKKRELDQLQQELIKVVKKAQKN